MERKRSSQEIEKKTDPFSDAKLGNTLAAVGNHEGKALLLASMKPEEKYKRTALSALTHVNGEIQWSEGTPSGWVTDSLSPIGMVSREIIDPDKGIVGYELTEEGQILGKAVAGHLLTFSEKHPHVSLEQLLGSTTSGSKGATTEQPQSDEDKLRSPLTRFRIFSEMVTSVLPIQLDDLEKSLQNDYPNEYGSEKSYLGEHIHNLAVNNIVSYDSAKGQKYSAFKKADNDSDKPLTYPEHMKSLTYQVREIVVNATQSLSYERIYDQLLLEYPQYVARNKKGLMANISHVATHLVKIGQIERDSEFSKEKQSTLMLAEPQKEVLTDFVELMEKIRANDPNFLAEGRQKAEEIISDPARFATLMIKSRENSKHANFHQKVDIETKVTQYLMTHPNSTNHDIQQYLRSKGVVYALHSVRVLTNSFKAEGKILSNKIGRTNYFSAVQENVDQKTSGEIVLYRSE